MTVISGTPNDDTIELPLGLNGDVEITTGAGSDTIRFVADYFSRTIPVVTDFTAGAGGDIIDALSLLQERVLSWNPATNPFTDGYLVLIQQGNDVLFAISTNGTSTAAGILLLKDVDIADLTAENFAGFDPSGAPPPGIEFDGSPDDDMQDGTGGNDTLNGEGGNDTLNGLSGDDTINGGDGADILDGGRGDDVIDGGDGDDVISDPDGDDIIIGGDGNDRIEISRFYEHRDQTLSIDAGEDNDTVIYSNDREGTATINLGAGDDILTIERIRDARITLGAGSDTVNGVLAQSLNTVITDFESGNSGDVLDLAAFAAQNLNSWDQQGNPFSGLYLVLAQEGDDTVVYYNNVPGNFANQVLLTLENVQADTLTSFNFGGYDPAAAQIITDPVYEGRIPLPDGRPDIAPITTWISEADTGSARGPGFVYDYYVAPNDALYAENVQVVFDNAVDGLNEAYWGIVNDGVIWSSITRESDVFGNIYLISNLYEFTNNGRVVLEIDGPRFGGSILRLVSPNETQLESFTNNGEIYVVSAAPDPGTATTLGISSADGLLSYAIRPEIVNNGLLAVRADGGGAAGFRLQNGGDLVNTANGHILVEGQSAFGIVATVEGHIENYGLIEAVATRPGLRASIGVASYLGTTFTNHEGGVVTADIAVNGSLWVNNFGELNGAVVAHSSAFFILENGSTGVINGNVLLGNDADTVTNSGTINGNVYGFVGDDEIDNSAGIISGIVDLGLGNDTYHGSVFGDLVAGDNGRDSINGNDGNDLLLGGGSDDTLDGGAGNDGLYGETGQDIIITQDADYVDGGIGDDVVRLGDYSFAFATGGSGFDTLALAAGARALDLSMVISSGRLQSFEHIEMSGDQRVVIRSGDVAALTGSLGELIVSTTASDNVELVGAWVSGGTVTIDGQAYASYTLAGSRVLVGGAGAASVVVTATGGAIGLDAVADGPVAPEPGDKSGLYLTPLELFVQALELREDMTLEIEETWFTNSSTVAVYSQIDGVNFTIDGVLLAVNAEGARAIGISFLNRSSVEVNGLVSVQSNGLQDFPHRDSFPSGREGAIAIDDGYEVINNGRIEALSDHGMAAAVGWARIALFTEEESLVGEGEGIGDDIFNGQQVGQVYNYGEIVSEAALGHAFGVTVAYLLNAAGATIEVTGRRAAIGATTNGDLENHGTIVASLTPDGTGRSYGIVVLQGGGFIISDPADGDQTIVNTGLVEADYALVATSFNSDSNAVYVENSGELRGQVVMGNSTDYVTNSGLITGSIELAFQDDIFDGSEGIQLGPIFGQGGNDTLIGGREADILVGGADNDTLDGGGNVDTAIVSGLQADYTVTQTSTGVFQVVGADGSDILTNIEYLQFDDATIRLLNGTGVSVNFETADRSVYQAAMENIRDFGGNALGGNGGWLRIGAADVNGDGDVDQILVNQSIGRFATVGTAEDGLVYFDDHGWAGETRVAGIYIDPLVASGEVVAGSDSDSQRRFQNDLEIQNINRVLGADDYDGDGLQEVYFALTDGTAYLHAYMHADGNIQYANYQSEQQVIDFLTANGFGPETYADWFPSGQESQEAQDAPQSTASEETPERIHAFSDDPWANAYVEPNGLELAQFQFIEAFA